MARPEDAIYPINTVKNLNVVHSTGEGGWAVATMAYGEDPFAVGIRWNGDGSNGYPTARQAKPVWFIVPDELQAAVLNEAIRLRNLNKAA